MKVSLIVSSYGERDLLGKTLQSLDAQTADPEAYEVVVVEGTDGSDSSAAMKNRGIRKARYAICCFLNEGVLLAPDAVESLLQVHGMPNRVCIGRIHGLFQPDHHPALPLLRRIYESADPLKCFKHPLLPTFGDGRQKDLEAFSTSSTPWLLLNAALFSVESSVLHEVGLFDEDFRDQGFEDRELGIRLWQKGCLFRFEPRFRGLIIRNRQRLAPGDADRVRLVEKHRALEVELSSIQTEHNPFSLIKHFKQAISLISMDYPGIGEAIPPMLTEKRLAVGCHSDRLAHEVGATDSFTMNSTTFQSSSDGVGACRVVETLGLLSGANDQHYDTVVVTDSWRIVPHALLQPFFKEMQRIGKTVYLLSSSQLEVRNQLMQSFQEIEQIHSFQIKTHAVQESYTIYELC
ncbi:hypothetical protein [Gorillibacterium sp. CAU 1737]|uniref:glycosyltransferase family 2 protein n=1 Tax=Gorillibacterium sp. CAU 1737 TaxID=3140362 RepID=UPI00326026CE